VTTFALPQIKGQDLITNSRRQKFQTCNRRHFYEYELGVRPDNDPSALRIGGTVHKSLEAFWNGDGHAGAMQPIFANYETLPPWCNTDEQMLDWQYEFGTVIELMDGYIRHWNDSTPKAVAVELEFNLPILNPDTGAKSRTFNMAGKIDAIAYMPMLGARLAVVEHKTTGDDISPGSDYWRRLRIDSQISQYMNAARRLGHEVETVLYDVIKKPGMRPYRATPMESRKYKADGTLYANQREHPETPDEWRARLAEDIAQRPDHYYQRVEIPRLDSDLKEFEAEMWQTAEMLREAKNKNRWPRNTGACIGFGRCPYLDICATGIDISSLPLGMKRLDNVNPELSGERE